jgi:peptidyl-tRNA hydrolase, PTH2 family
MPGAAVRKPRDPVEQAVIIRRDLAMKFRQVVPQVSRAAIEFLVDRLRKASAGNAIALTAVEREWLDGRRAQRYLRVYGEAALLGVAERARAAGLLVYLSDDGGDAGSRRAATPMCCAIGPAPTGDIDRIVGNLPLW